MAIRKAKTLQDAHNLENSDPLPEAKAWLQWKGTDVCMDWSCKCGQSYHIDTDFVYSVKCPACGTVYACNSRIELIELEVEPDSCCVEGDY